MEASHTNRLSGETSPYLLQHAHNPVDWYPWGPEAMDRAKNENIPLLVSIGYSACHWCHVMEKESFENEETASLMNRLFVNIKIDREERPDLDHIYMDAVQAMTGSGGWPLHVFLTPEGKPFYGGTYFPPRPAYNRPSWKDILVSISAAFRDKRAQVETESEHLTEYLRKSGKGPEGGKEAAFRPASLARIYAGIMEYADTQEGGFGSAPKFPQTFVIQFLLQYYYFTGQREARDQACLSLDKMIRGGIYDHLGGGFCRYSTDRDWLVPHFEKMLYDNALLVSTLSDAYALTARVEYRDRIDRTLGFVTRELMSPEGGFYSALDADSEGVEGKYYVWDKSEIRELLGHDADIFCTFYQVSEAGNWEGRSILHTQQGIHEFAEKAGLNLQDLLRRLELCRAKLLMARNQRVPPQRDEKILLGWNALMITAFCRAFAATGQESYRETACRSMTFLLEHFRGSGIHHFHHGFKDGRARFPAFLDDYAFLVRALIDLQEITGGGRYLREAREITLWTLEHFGAEEDGYCYYTHEDQTDILLRKKEFYDGALASGNSVMASNLLYLSVVFDEPAWRERAAANISGLGDLIQRHPLSFGIWATLFQALSYTIPEIVICGTDIQQIHKKFLATYLPLRVYQSATSQNDDFPLLKDKPLSQTHLIFLCKDYACQNPVTELSKLSDLLGYGQKNIGGLAQ